MNSPTEKSGFEIRRAAPDSPAAVAGAAAAALGAIAVLDGILYELLSMRTVPAVDPLMFAEPFRRSICPEPAERTAYAVGVLLFPLMATAALWRLRRKPISRRAGAAAGAAAGVLATGCFLIPGEWLGFLFPDVFGLPLWPMWIATAAAALWGLTRCNPGGERSRNWIFGAALGWTALTVVATKLYPVAMQNELFAFHLDPVAYAVSQGAVRYCDTLQYGAYAQFLAPVFAIAGLSLRTLSTVMTVLTFAVFAAWIGILWKILRTPWLIALGTLVLIGITMVWTVGAPFGFDPYYQYFPVRALFPVLGALLALRTGPASLRTTLTAGAVAGAALIWNFDSGVAAAAALGAVTVLRTAPERRLGSTLRAAGWFAAAGIAVCALWYLWYSGVRGEWFDLREFFSHLRAFSFYGVLMIPLPAPPAAWCAALGFYAFGLTAALGAVWFRPGRTASPRLRITAYLAVLGPGLFLYYQGRSFPSNLASCGYPAILLSVIFADAALRRGTGRRDAAAALFRTGALLPLLALGSVTLLGTVPRTPTMVKRVLAVPDDWRPGPFDADARFIRFCAQGRPATIWGVRQGALYAETGLTAAIPRASEVELVYRGEVERVMAAVAASDAPLFLTANFETGIPIPEDIVREHYQWIADGPGGRVRYYEPKKNPQPGKVP